MGKSINSIEHFVFVCNGKDCKKHRAKEITKSFKYELKRQGLRDKSHLVKTKCVGFCKQAPVVLIKDIYFSKVKPADCESLVAVQLTKKETSFETS